MFREAMHRVRTVEEKARSKKVMNVACKCRVRSWSLYRRKWFARLALWINEFFLNCAYSIINFLDDIVERLRRVEYNFFPFVEKRRTEINDRSYKFANSLVDRYPAAVDPEDEPSSIMDDMLSGHLTKRFREELGLPESLIIRPSKETENLKATEESKQLGTEEGAICNRDGCFGKIKFSEPENCSCHLGHAPCGSCSSIHLSCPECDWTDESFS